MPGFARVSRASVKELRDRVGSVKNTKKITSAMKLVAAAKVRRAQDAVLKTRPFSETLQKVLGGLIVRLKKDNFDSPLMQDRPVKKVCSLCSPWHLVVEVVPCVFRSPRPRVPGVESVHLVLIGGQGHERMAIQRSLLCGFT